MNRIYSRRIRRCMQIEEAQKHEQEALEQKSLLEGKNKELEKQIDELLK